MEKPLSRALFEDKAYIEAKSLVGTTLQPNRKHCLYICNVSRYVPIRQIVYLNINHTHDKIVQSVIYEALCL